MAGWIVVGVVVAALIVSALVVVPKTEDEQMAEDAAQEKWCTEERRKHEGH